MGYRPKHFTPGYASANDYTFPALEALGFTHGLVSMPTRNLPQCACVWGNSPMDAHYPHRYNRCLVGDVNFVDIPHTIDWESRMWGGAHPQDLRIELVDAKTTGTPFLKISFASSTQVTVSLLNILKRSRIIHLTIVTQKIFGTLL